MWTSFRHYRSSSPKHAGFTLVELLVVVAVITIITAFILFNQGKFNSATLLRSLAYSVALTVRQAQVYGVSVRGLTSGGNSSFVPGYGTYISTADLARVYLFGDLNNNGQYDSSPTDERLGTSSALIFGTAYSISKFCGVRSSAVQDCNGAGVGGGQAITSLTIYFRRPEPDACVASSIAPGACAPNGSAIYTGAYIQVTSSGSSDVRSVRVTNTGQIVVCQLNADPLTC